MPKCQNAKKLKCPDRFQEGKMPKMRTPLGYLMNMMLHLGTNYVYMTEKDQILN